MKYLLWIGIISVLLLFLLLYCLRQRANDNPTIFYRNKLFKNYNGYIVPPFGIFIKESERDNAALLEHEMIHWKQFQREGLLSFLFNYSKQSIKKGYDKNPYEIEARTAETEYCKLNYTECIRSGASNTTYNPNFRS